MTALTPEIVTSAIQALPGRPSFMLAPPLAAFYGVTPKVVGQAVSRNPERFPEDFVFSLTEAETELLRSQNVTANSISAPSAKARYAPLAFTEPGALALSGVLKTQRAAEVSVFVFRAFAAMRAAERDELRARLISGRAEWIAAKPRRAKILALAEAGLSFNGIWRQSGLSRVLVAETLRSLVAMGMLATLPPGAEAAPRQIDLFAAV